MFLFIGERGDPTHSEWVRPGGPIRPNFQSIVFGYSIGRFHLLGSEASTHTRSGLGLEVQCAQTFKASNSVTLYDVFIYCRAKRARPSGVG